MKTPRKAVEVFSRERPSKAKLPRWLYRGFTGHEHLNRSRNDDFDAYGREFNLINMNGRLYDPINGRMLSVDNYAHDGAGTQGYNRYSYANNNPLKYTDPDGEVPFFIIPNVGWSSSGGLSIGLEFGIGIPGLLSASVTVGYSFGSKQLSASIQGGAVGFYAGYGTGGAFAGFGFNHGGVNLGAGISYSGDGNWDFNAGVSLGGSSGNYNGSIGVGWSLSSGFGVNVGAGYTHPFEIDRYRKKAPEFVPKNSVGGVQSVEDDCCPGAAALLEWSTGVTGGLALDPVPGDEVLFGGVALIVIGAVATYEYITMAKDDPMKGGKKSSRDRDFGIKDKNFWEWWHNEGKNSGKGRGGRDIENKKEADGLFKEWNKWKK